MKNRILLVLTLMLLTLAGNAQVFKKQKTIYVEPDNAIISIGGTEVGQGQYNLTIGKQDFVVVKLSAPGYITKTVKIYKGDKATTYSYKLENDDAYAASGTSDIANKSMSVIVEKKTEDEAWKRIVYYTSENFPDMQIQDKTTGWLRSAWTVQSFNYVNIRTRVEIKQVPGMEKLTYKVTLQSEIADRNCGLDDQCFVKWDRLLKRYAQMIQDLLNSLN